MKTISIFEKKDFSIIRNAIGYYFEGDGGFLKRQGLPKYDFDLDDADMIKLTDKLEGNDSKDIHGFICSAIENSRKAIEKKENELVSLRNDIILKQRILESFKVEQPLAITMKAIIETAKNDL